MASTQVPEIVIFTNRLGTPSTRHRPELRVDGRIIELPRVSRVVAELVHDDVSRVSVTFVATLRYEVVP